MCPRRPEWVFPVVVLFIVLLSSVVKAQTTLATGATPGQGPGGVTGYISACQGTASVNPSIESFPVSGSDLTANVTVTAPSNFEVSLDPNNGYSNSISIQQSGGNINNVPVYVRSATTAPAGKIYGNVILNSPGAPDGHVPVTGTIYAVPTVSAQPVAQELATGAFTTALNFTGAGNTYTWTNDMPSIGLPASGTGNIPSFPTINNSNNKVTATITVTPQQIAYAYITNQQTNTVSVINTTSNTVVGTIGVGQRPTGTAVSPDGTKVYITNQFDNSISVISTLTNKVMSTIPLKDSGPTGIALSPDGKTIYVVNLGLNSVSAIDAASGNVTSTFAVGGYPIGIVVSPDGNNVFVTNGSDNISDINLAKGNTTTIPVANGPYEVVISPDGTKLYVTNSGGNTVSVIDVSTGAIIAVIPVGTNPEGIAINSDGTALCVTNESSGTVSIINTATYKVSTIQVGVQPIGVSFTSDGNYVYVTNQGENTVSVINILNNVVTATVPVGNGTESLGNFITPGSECPGIPAKFTITVDPTALAPTIIAGNVTGNIIACTGSASAYPDISQFTVSGKNLNGDITITAPLGFEVSFNATAGYSSRLVTTQSGGSVQEVTIYVRSAANAPTGNISGNIVLTSSGAISRNIPVTGIVNTLPSVDPVADQIVAAGSTTSVVTFTGNTTIFDWTNDTPSIGLPASGTGNILPFTAINNTNSPVKANVTVVPEPSGNSLKCAGIPFIFTITVEPSSNTGITQNIIVPNTFTPNGDGVNDTWEIKSLGNYPKCTVAIYNRWGEKLYSSIGYPIPWDGTYKGVNLPVGTYYYIIILENGVKAISGWVAIVK
ncbi:MAG: gliding motility-associated C-terminal domain-containing protein [Mucilaginibacter sp.]